MDFEDDLRSGFRVSQHEYIHLLARYQSRFWPLWLNEGFASCFESAVVEKNRIVFGKPMQRIAEILREKRGPRSRSQFALSPLQPFNPSVSWKGMLK